MSTRRHGRPARPLLSAMTSSLTSPRSGKRWGRQGCRSSASSLKKKELGGTVKNAGQTWSREADAVNVDDVLAEGQGRAVPYGVYDLAANRGSVVVGSSGDP